MIWKEIARNFLQSSTIKRLLIILLLVVLLFGAVIHFIEPYNFKTIFDGIYWVIVTVSTVGYGDFAPKSMVGRILSMVLIFLGAGFMTFYMATIAATVIETLNGLTRGKIAFNGTNHIILIGWNEKTKQMIEQFEQIKSKTNIILIDYSLKKSPRKSIHFINGDPTEDHTLIKANVKQASIVFISSDQQKDEDEADMHSILSLLAIRGLNSSVYCLVEILSKEQTQNAVRAGADEIIETNALSSYMMVNSIFSHGISTPLIQLLDQLKGSRLNYISATEEYQNVSIHQCRSKLLEKGYLVIGVKRGENSIINPPLRFTIHEEDKLLIIQS